MFLTAAPQHPEKGIWKNFFWHHPIETALPAHLSARGAEGVTAPIGTREADAAV